MGQEEFVGTNPPADTPKQVEEKLQAALDKAQVNARAKEVAQHIVETAPEHTPTPAPEVPTPPAVPEAPAPREGPLEEYPTKETAQSPFEPTQESVQADRDRIAAEQAERDRIASNPVGPPPEAQS